MAQKKKLKLEKNQIWRQDDQFYKITGWARLSIRYRSFKDVVTREGEESELSKKEFCRLIKGGELMNRDSMEAYAASLAAPTDDSEE